MLNVRSVAVLLACVGSLPPSSASARINFTKTAYHLSLGIASRQAKAHCPLCTDSSTSSTTTACSCRCRSWISATSPSRGRRETKFWRCRCRRPCAFSRLASRSRRRSSRSWPARTTFSSTSPPTECRRTPGPRSGSRGWHRGQSGNHRSCAGLRQSELAIVLARLGIPGVSVLVGNYYSFDHPEPHIELSSIWRSNRLDESGRPRRQHSGRHHLRRQDGQGGLRRSVRWAGPGLLLINRQNGYVGGLTFEIHPSNAGHSVMAHGVREGVAGAPVGGAFIAFPSEVPQESGG